MQGFRLIGGEYVPIEPIAGRLPSEVVGLHLAREGQNLRLIDPATGNRLLTRLEAREAAERLAEEERRRAEEEHDRAEQESRRAEAAEGSQRHLAEENERLRREIELLKGR